MRPAPATTPILDWRDVPPDELESHFNPRVAVADAQELLDARAADSAAARERVPGQYDLRYGPAPKQTYDLHRPPANEAPMPVLIFVHGGYWRALDKSDHSFLAPAFLDAGVAFVSLNYDLCPTVTLSELTTQVLDGIQHLAENAQTLGLDPHRLFLMGHSAGAHSAAMALAEDWGRRGFDRAPLAGAICVSGIYDTQVVPRLAVNAEVQLTPEQAVANNALARPPRPGPAILITVGGEEPAGWIGQSAAYHALCAGAGVEARLEIVPGANHFTVLSATADPDHAAHRQVLAFMGGP